MVPTGRGTQIDESTRHQYRMTTISDRQTFENASLPLIQVRGDPIGILRRRRSSR
jgi:hypothetical protein